MKDKKIDYSKELFVVITKENQDKIINEFCSYIFSDNTTNLSIKTCSNEKNDDNDVFDKSDYYYNQEILANMLFKFPKPLTVVQEPHHIDRCFRDTYYMYFSNQHFDVTRYSKRLSFFYGNYSFEEFFSNDPKIEEKIQENFIGACVINPLSTGAIGRTLINPKYLIKNDNPIYMRLTDFKLHIYGKTLYICAFPYRMQDGETTSCAEITLLNLLEYYSNSFGDYKTVLPSEIISSKQNHNHERALPTKGMSYPLLTKVLSEFGLSPRLYSVSAMDQFDFSRIKRDNEMQRWLHYYIESGIPVAVNLSPLDNVGSGHSVICIGHGSLKENLVDKAKQNKWLSWNTNGKSHAIINSADFYEDYIIVDDNQPVYQVKSFNNLSSYQDMKVSDISVPLYKRMFLDAPDAYAIISSLLQHKQYGFYNWTGDFLAPNEDVVIRLFMASSHKLKQYRANTLDDVDMKKVYATLPMPRFVWVCELYRFSDYNNLNAFGEIIIDATSTYNCGAKSLILMNYLGEIAVRTPEQSDINFNMLIKTKECNLFPGYKNNLTEFF